MKKNIIFLMSLFFITSCDDILGQFNGSAVAILEKNMEKFIQECNDNVGDACADIASEYLKSNYTINNNYIIAEKYYQQACDLNSAKGCIFLGLLYQPGINVKCDGSADGENSIVRNSSKEGEYVLKGCYLAKAENCDLYKQEMQTIMTQEYDLPEAGKCSKTKDNLQSIFK